MHVERRIFSTRLLGLFILFFSLSACLPPEERQIMSSSTELDYISERDLTGIRVGYCSPTMNGPFYVALERAVREAAEAYGMTYMSTDGQGDITRQVMAVEDLLSKDIQLLILNPLDPQALVPIVNLARAQGVEVFILDSTIEEGTSYTSALFAHNMLNGELLGLWLAEQNLADPQIAIISGNQGNPVGREKRLGFVRGLADGQLHRHAKTSFDIVAQGWGGWNNNGGLAAMEDILVAHPYVNVLLAENDAMALGAMKVIQQMGMEDQITVLGFDGQKEAYEMIQAGRFAVTAQNSPQILGETMVELIARHLNGEEIDKVNYTPSVLISSRNVEQFYDPNALF